MSLELSQGSAHCTQLACYGLRADGAWERAHDDRYNSGWCVCHLMVSHGTGGALSRHACGNVAPAFMHQGVWLV